MKKEISVLAGILISGTIFASVVAGDVDFSTPVYKASEINSLFSSIDSQISQATSNLTEKADKVYTSPWIAVHLSAPSNRYEFVRFEKVDEFTSRWYTQNREAYLERVSVFNGDDTIAFWIYRLSFGDSIMNPDGNAVALTISGYSCTRDGTAEADHVVYRSEISQYFSSSITTNTETNVSRGLALAALTPNYSGNTNTITLVENAYNSVEQGVATRLNLIFPASSTPGYSRTIYFVFTCSDASQTEINISTASLLLPNGDTSIIIPEPGVNIYKFEEVIPGTFLVTRTLGIWL